MSDTFFIRNAETIDANILCDAERQVTSMHPGLLVSLADELQPNSFADRISNATTGRGKYVVAVTNNNIVGHASMYPMERSQLAHIMRLDMCVHLGHWRKGHGRAMLNHLIDWAKTSTSTHKIELLVRSTNTAAIKLYISCGFTEEGRHKDRIKLQNGYFVDDIAMALILRRDRD